MKTGRMKKQGIIFLVCLLLLGAVGCGTGTTPETNSSIEGLVEGGKLIFVVDDSVVPCVYRNAEGELEGFEYDCGNAIAEYLGLEPVWVSNAWENLITTVQAGKADAIVDGLYITEERKKAINYCESYYSMDCVIVVAEGNESIVKPEDLVGKKVGVQPASPDGDYVRALGVKDIVEYSKIPDGMSDLLNGRIDAYVTESLSAAYYAKSGGYELRMDQPLGSFEVGIATNKNAPEVTAAINEAIRALKEDGTLSAISVKWFGEDIIKR